MTINELHDYCRYLFDEKTMCMACLTSGAKATSSRSALSCSNAMRD